MLKEQEIYKACMEYWGLEKQLRKLQEECAECIVAVNKLLDDKPNGIKNLTEKLGDVQNMVNQIKTICPDFEKARIEKLERVAKLLEVSKC